MKELLKYRPIVKEVVWPEQGRDELTSGDWPTNLLHMGSVRLHGDGGRQDRRFLFQPVEHGTPFEHELWRSVGGLTVRVFGEKQAAQLLPRLQPHWENLAAVDRGIPSDQRMISHSLRVGKLLNIWGNVDTLSLAGVLHDIGKSAYENPHVDPHKYKYQDILLSEDILGAEERKRMAGHTTDGGKILLEIGFPLEIAEVALDHHSTRFTPTSPLAQMVSIADDTDVVTHARTYKEAQPRSALREDAIINEKLERLGIPEFTKAYFKWVAEPERTANRTTIVTRELLAASA